MEATVRGGGKAMLNNTSESDASGRLILFLVAVMLPTGFFIGGVFLNPIRLLLLTTFVPACAHVLSGKAGRVTIVDKLMVGFGLWMILALAINHGTERLAFSVITAVELVGGYMLGRMYVTNISDYKQFFRLMLGAMLVMAPLALIETITGIIPISQILGVIPGIDVPHRGGSAYARWGLERAYVVFDHPILYGLFCSLTLANFVFLFRGNPAKITMGIVFAIAMTFMALSSAPLLACIVQLGLLTWGRVMNGRWKLFIALFVTGYVVVDLLSNRTPITILIETLTFNPGSGWIRIGIFEFGFAAVKEHPFFGIGFNDWPRPHWLTSSVDNFWLLTSMRYGMVGVGFLMLAFFTHIRSAGKIVQPDDEHKAACEAHVIALVGIAFTLVTVHMWGSASSLIMFYLGSGGFLYAYPQREASSHQDGDEEPMQETGRIRSTKYTRFSKTKKTG